MTRIVENLIEEWVVQALNDRGFTYLIPEYMDPDNSSSKRANYSDVILVEPLHEAINRINPTIPANAQYLAAREVVRAPGQGDLITSNQQFHKLLTEGIDVTYMNSGQERTQKVWLIDPEHPENNQWLVTHQVTILENGQNKRPDVIVYMNGIPVIVFELKNAADENATIEKAYQQLQTYHKTIPSLFTYNLLEVISDGLEAKVGTITSPLSRFMSWKTADGNTTASSKVNELSVMLDGLFQPEVLTELFLNFIVFERATSEDPKTKTLKVVTIKKVAGYHQYYAVKKAVASVSLASGENGNRKGGVVWHTQGSGKSLSMVFFTGMLVKALNNPTIVVITDRNDLDEQLFETFTNCIQLLRQTPIQIDSRETLVKELRNRQSGGVIFTTIQKFLPEDGSKTFQQLSDRKNVIVIADEAHRSQYGLEAKVKFIKDDAGNEVGADFDYGFAKHMRDALPNATFIGFTGTPVESSDKNTKAVFGEFIDIYDIERAVRDGATVPIYYENRFAKLKLKYQTADELEHLLAAAAEGLPDYTVQQAIEKSTRQESIVGHPDRISLIAQDIIEHFEERSTTLEGKALIVCMSRRIAVSMYNQIVELRPDWHGDTDETGKIKVIMTGSSSDDQELQPHIRNKTGRTKIAARLKEPSDELHMVIVVDMWLTGFDAPVLHTLYLDREMGGHNLMQAIARVNRVFNEKPGGLVVDYVPVTASLKAALKTYTENEGKGEPTLDIEQAVQVMLSKLEVIQGMMYGFDYQAYFTADISQRLNIILEAEEHILTLEKGKERFIAEVTALSKAHALVKVEPAAEEIIHEVAFFQAIRARLAKYDTQVTGQQRKEFEGTVKALVESAVATDGMINILDVAGMDRPEISIFSEDFMQEIRKMKQKNVAIEILKKLLSDRIKIQFKKNIVQNKSFSERLHDAVNRYNSKSITALEMIELLLEISGDVEQEGQRASNLGLNAAEKAFYDALAANGSARDLMGDDKLMVIAKELVDRVRRSTTIDWTIRQSAKDRVKLEVKRILRKYQYPPDDERRATDTVLEQAEMHAGELV